MYGSGRWDIDIQSCRTMTCKRADLQRGFEPDNCYYVRNEAVMRSKTELDLSTDPPPDLAIEFILGSQYEKAGDLRRFRRARGVVV